ncbi:MAG: hypothetical protein LC781_04145, partial [Actinobacteria bacterium]|nr:hypothetical protein [Actinomycetota bacterium]
LLKRMPLVGDSLTELAAGKGQQIIEARRDEFLQLLAQHLATLEEAAVRKDYFQTPEGFDLLVKALDEARKTRSKEKRDIYARILRGAIVDFEQGRYSAEEYLYLISDLTLKELRVARSLYKAPRSMLREEAWQSWRNKVCCETVIDKADLSMILSRISSFGLIESVVAGIDEENGFWVNVGDPGDAGFYRVTPSFEKLMKFSELEQ